MTCGLSVARIAALLMGSLAFVPSGLGAQQRQADPFKEAVVACAASVREESDKRAGYRTSDFDAFVRPGGSISLFGTAVERFRFDKCMNGSGFPLNLPTDRK